MGLTLAIAQVMIDPERALSSYATAAASHMRLPLLTVASLMAPGVLAWHGCVGTASTCSSSPPGPALLFLLVLARLLGLLRRVEEQAAEVALLATSDPLTGFAQPLLGDRDPPGARARRPDR